MGYRFDVAVYVYIVDDHIFIGVVHIVGFQSEEFAKFNKQEGQGLLSRERHSYLDNLIRYVYLHFP